MIDKSHLESNLMELRTLLPDIRSVLIATVDGILIAGATLDDKSNQLAAMTAAALGLGKRMIETAGAGNPNQISFSGSNGSVFVYALGVKAVLVVVTKAMPNIALVNWETQKVITRLGAAFA